MPEERGHTMSRLSLSIQLFRLEHQVRRLPRSISSPIPNPHRGRNLATVWLMSAALALVLSSLMYAQAPVQMKGRDAHYRGDLARMYAQPPFQLNGHDLEYRADSAQMYMPATPLVKGRDLQYRRDPAQMYAQKPSLMNLGDQQYGSNHAQRIAEKTSPYLVRVISGRTGKVENVGSGIVLNSSGVIITSYQLVKDATALLVRLGGKDFDQVVLLAYNESRDLAALRISSAYLNLPLTRSQGLELDEPVYVVWKGRGDHPNVAIGALKTTVQGSSSADAPNQPALLEFAAALESPARGAALVDRHGNVLGMVTGTAGTDGFHRAIPMTALLHFSAFSGRIFEPGSELRLANGSDSLHDVQPAKLGKYNRTFAVSSATILIPRDHMLQALRNQRDFAALDLVLLEDHAAAEVLVEVDHIPWTFDYTFKVVDHDTSAVIGAGRVTAFNGYIAAGDLADKIVKQMKEWKATAKAAEPKATEDTEKK